ncbi:hypothetical protein KWH26_003693 [Salmonella enterica]|nr:hypothetical protein [Salmonella enterica]EHS7647083.1 hypothetical protein [Salmonella enterica]
MEAQEKAPHAPIIGHRSLTEAQLDLINRIKAKGLELMQLFEEVAVSCQDEGNALWAETQNAETRLKGAQLAQEESAIALATEQLETAQDAFMRFQIAEGMRWASIGRTDIQTGVMALVRAVAQPDSLI